MPVELSNDIQFCELEAAVKSRVWRPDHASENRLTCLGGSYTQQLEDRVAIDEDTLEVHIHTPSGAMWPWLDLARTSPRGSRQRARHPLRTIGRGEDVEASTSRQGDAANLLGM